MATVYSSTIIFCVVSTVFCGSVESTNVNDRDILRRLDVLEKRGFAQNEVIRKLTEKLDEQNETIQKQTLEITKQKELIEKQQADIDVLKHHNKYPMKSSESDIKDVKRFVVVNEGPIAFHARIDQGAIEHIGLTQKLVFDITVLNNGDGYHNSTGIFVAPVDGLYFFSLSVCILHPGKDVHAQIMKNGVKVAGAYANGYDQGSISTVTPLVANDEVWVSSLYHPDTYLWGDTLTSFMGFKMADY